MTFERTPRVILKTLSAECFNLRSKSSSIAGLALYDAVRRQDDLALDSFELRESQPARSRKWAARCRIQQLWLGPRASGSHGHSGLVRITSATL
jgi:hypothetical protein